MSDASPIPIPSTSVVLTPSWSQHAMAGDGRSSIGPRAGVVHVVRSRDLLRSALVIALFAKGSSQTATVPDSERARIAA